MGDSSKLPDGGYQPTFASNFMLDGFNFSEEYGEGAATGRDDPDPNLPRSQNGMAVLPDGFVTGHTASDLDVELSEDAFGNLSGYLKEASPLVDLSWLETATQDPDRLPKNHNRAVIDGLVEAWGVNRRTDGVSLVPNVKFLPQARSMTSRLPGDQYRDLVLSAMRRSAFGDSFENIIRDVSTYLGGDLAHVHEVPALQKLAASIRDLRSEHGVVGKVYLREEAFPALLSGKWDSAIKKRCASAPYWLTRPGTKLAAYENYLGKKVVTEIPWREAREHFRPMLEATGRKLASGDPRTALVNALASEVAAKARKEAGVPVTSPVDTVSMEEAWRVFASAPMPVQEVVALRDDSLRRAREQVARWVSSGLLSRDDGTKLLQSGASPESLVKVGAARIAASGKEVTYIGQGVGVHTLVQSTRRDAVWAQERQADVDQKALTDARAIVVGYVKAGSLTKNEGDKLLTSTLSAQDLVRYAQARINDPNRVVPAPTVEHRKYAGAEFTQNSKVQQTVRNAQWAAEREGELEALSVNRAKETILGLVKAGSLSQRDAEKVIASGLSPKQMVRVAEARAMDPNKPTTIPKTETRTYSDKTYTQHVAEKPQKEAHPVEVQKLLRWASIQMNEGAAGNDLDYLLKAKFNGELIKSASSPLVQIRKKHEGLAGHLYVDASAYASTTGTTGCDRGGLQHRANSIPSVLEMPRCGSCASNVDGGCLKYNKPLVNASDLEGTEKFQKETLRLANGGDEDRIAALFAKGYSQEEYGLQNDSLDMIDFESLPTNEELGKIIYGGLLVPTGDLPRFFKKEE